MEFAHLVARTIPPHRPFVRHELAGWAWDHLKRRFPLALGCFLMPNHCHLITPSRDPTTDHRGLLAVLGQLGPRIGLPGPLWDRFPPPTLITESSTLRRHLRYLALQACRARLANDPLCWLWSTHRDLVGAAAVPWITPQRLAAVLGDPADEFLARWHRFVSADSSTAVAGTTLPRPWFPGLDRPPLAAIAAAACAATRDAPSALLISGACRTGLVHLALEAGWRTSDLQAWCRVGLRTLQRIVYADPGDVLPAMRLCLGDARLHGVGRWQGAEASPDRRHALSRRSAPRAGRAGLVGSGSGPRDADPGAA